MWGREAPTLLFPQILEVGCSSRIYFQISASQEYLWIGFSTTYYHHYSPGYQADQGVIKLRVTSAKYGKNPARKIITLSFFRKPIGCTFLRENIHKICEVILAELFPSKQAKVELEHGKMVKNQSCTLLTCSNKVVYIWYLAVFLDASLEPLQWVGWSVTFIDHGVSNIVWSVFSYASSSTLYPRQ